MNIQELIRDKQKQMASKKAANIRTIKPLPGKNVYRILPSWRVGEDGVRSSQFWHDFGMHYIKTEPNAKKVAAVYLCLDKTFGRECPVCSGIGQGIRSADTDDQIDLLKEANSGQKYLMNALHRNGDKPNEPQLLEVGITVFEAICETIAEYGDITDLVDGVDLLIKREGTGFDTKYTVMPAPKSKPVADAVLEGLIDIDAAVAQENETRQAAALNSLGTIVGLLPPPATRASASAASDLNSFDEEIEFATEVPSEPAKASKAAKAVPESATIDDSPDLDDDDFESMLAELDG